MCKYIAILLLLAGQSWSESFSNQWSTLIPGGLEAARKVAEDTGCQLMYEIIPGEDFFLLQCHHVQRRSVERHEEVHRSLEDHSHVDRAEQQVVKNRRRRQWGLGGYNNNQFGGLNGLYQQQQPWRMPQQQTPAIDPNTPFDNSMKLNDPRFPLMWYVNRGGMLDMNVQGAWELGITGKNIVVTILDDGVEKGNPDLVANYDPQASADVNDNDPDPTPRYDLIDSNRHGTRCAGEVSASANNSICGVGIAYDSKIGGVRMLDGDVTDAVEARSLSLNSQHIDIYSASWGPDDDGKTVDGPGNLASRAFINGVANGRKGRGSIFVWASGNGGRDHDNCNCDGYTNSIWTLSVSSATENGLIPWYSEACSSTMATTYSSGSSGERKVITTDLHNGCTSGHTGTSASAPMAAGVVALVLEANPELTWRDVQHITIRNSHVANLRASDWRVNSLGRNYSHSFGYGVMDATGMVKMALKWKNVGTQVQSAVKASIGSVTIPASSSRSAKMEVTDHGNVNFLEHVQAHVTVEAARRGDLAIFLTSPQGTKSQLLARRPHDSSRAGFHDWPFLTVFSWGENPAGSWELEVQNEGRYQATLTAWSITFHGTEQDPDKVALPGSSPSPSPSPSPPAPAQSPTPSPSPAKVRPSVSPVEAAVVPAVSGGSSASLVSVDNCYDQSEEGLCRACKVGFRTLGGRCVKQCPSQGYYEGVANSSTACLSCYYSCQTCHGPNDYECLTCYGDAELDTTSSIGKYCHNKNLVSKIFSSSRWYYVMTLGFIANFAVVLCLIVYILRKRKAKAGKQSLLDRVKSPANRFKGLPSKLSTSLPYHDYEESSSEIEDFVKPYSDEPETNKFIKPYTDDE